MRRTQARQMAMPFPTSGPVRLAELRCCGCGAACDREGAVFAVGRNGNGAIAMQWCCPDHARAAGWPWLKGERGGERRP